MSTIIPAARQRSNANLKPWQPGQSGNPAGNPARARKELNADTIRAMHAAFREGGRAAIDKVMRNQPAVFLKLLVLLVPRELEVTHSNSLKNMSDEALEEAIAAVEAMLAKRAGNDAKVIEASAAPGELDTSETPRITRKASREVGRDMGTDEEGA